MFILICGYNYIHIYGFLFGGGGGGGGVASLCPGVMIYGIVDPGCGVNQVCSNAPIECNRGYCRTRPGYFHLSNNSYISLLYILTNRQYDM